MNSYLKLLLLLIATILMMFFIIINLDMPLLSDPSDLINTFSISAAITGIILLISDIVLPIPSSLIMIANGAVFGLYVGCILSLIGGLGASITGYLIGKYYSDSINKFISSAEQERASKFISRYGWFALVVSRSIPVLAESVSLLAGTCGVRPVTMIMASFVGLIPAAIIYAAVGANGINFNAEIWSFILVIAIATFTWMARKLIFKTTTSH